MSVSLAERTTTIRPVAIAEMMREPQQSRQEAKLELQTNLKKELAEAWRTGQSVRISWIREEKEGPIKVIVDGLPSQQLKGTRGTDSILSFPAGAKGTAFNDSDVIEDKLSKFGVWKRVEAKYANGKKPQKTDDKKKIGGGLSLDDDLLTSFKDQPFAVVVDATPVKREMIQNLWEDAAEKYRPAKSKDRIPKFAEIANAAKVQMEELEDGVNTGYWNIRMATGTLTQADSEYVTGRVMTSVNGIESRTFNPVTHGFGNTYSGFHGGTDLLADLWSFPENDIHGLMYIDKFNYGVNLEKRDIDIERRISLGRLLDNDDTDAGEFYIDAEDLVAHLGIFGLTRSGKTSTLKRLLQQLSELKRGPEQKGVTWTVISPTKTEGLKTLGAAHAQSSKIRHQVNKDVIYWKIGTAEEIAGGFNLIEPEEGYSPEDHEQHVIDLLDIAYDGEEESRGTYRSFMINGMRGNEAIGTQRLNRNRHPLTGRPLTRHHTPWAKPRDLMNNAVDHAYNVGYDESQDGGAQLIAFIRNKLSGVDTGRTGRFFNGYPLSTKELLSRNTIIDTEGCDDLLLLTLFLRINEYAKVQEEKRKIGGQVPLQHVLVIEEAHRYFKKLKERPGLSSVLVQMAAELGEKGIGLVFVDQSPQAIDENIIINTGTKIIHKLETDADRRAVTGNLTGPEREYIGKLGVGETVVTTREMRGRPYRVKMHDPRDLPQEKGPTQSPSVLIDVNSTENLSLYDAKTQIDGAFFLDNFQEGNLVNAVAEFAVMGQVLFDDITVTATDEIKARIENFFSVGSFDLSRNTLNAAIDIAVANAVFARSSELAKSIDLKELIVHVSKRLRNSFAASKEQQQSRPDLVIDRTKLNPYELQGILRPRDRTGLPTIDQIIIRQMGHMEEMHQLDPGETRILEGMVREGEEERWMNALEILFSALVMNDESREFYNVTITALRDRLIRAREAKKAKENPQQAEQAGEETSEEVLVTQEEGGSEDVGTK
jgi:hypothetical protein